MQDRKWFHGLLLLVTVWSLACVGEIGTAGGVAEDATVSPVPDERTDPDGEAPTEIDPDGGAPIEIDARAPMGADDGGASGRPDVDARTGGGDSGTTGGSDYGGYRPHYQGFGTTTPGGRGGAVYRVTQLGDSGAGSFREAVEATGPRIVMFEVSGTIVLRSRLHITHPFLTIAGQTAPSPGITINARCGVRLETNDVVMQHVRIRRGDYDSCGDLDDIWVRNSVHDVVFDHVSLSWGVDGTLDFNAASGDKPHDICVLDSIVSETLRCSIYGALDPSRACHSRAMLVAGRGAIGTMTLARNYFAHNASRNPSVKGGWRLMHVNNVVYDYAPDTAAHGPIAYVNGPSAGPYEIADVNEIVQIGTLTIPGPSTPSAIIPIRTQNLYPGSTMYLEDNVGYGMTGPHGDAQWSGVWDTGRLTSVRDFRVDSVPSWFSAFGMDVLPSSEVEGYVLANAGARPLDRDAIDARVTDDCRRRAGHLIDGQGEVGGLPTLTEHRRALSVPADPHTVVDAAGRTRIEAWLEGLAQDLEPPRP